MRLLLIVLGMLGLFVGCPSTPTPNSTSMQNLNQAVTLSVKRAARGEQVTLKLQTSVTPSVNTVWVAGVTAQVDSIGIEIINGITYMKSITFKIPPGIPGGPQTVTLQNDSLTVSTTIGVLGDVKPNTVIAIFKPGILASDVINPLALHGFTLKAFHLLSPPLKPQPENACSGALGEIDVGGKPLGQALEELEGDDIIRNVNPESLWGIVAANHLEAIGAPLAHRNQFRGDGTTIAVLDTGVSAHPELGDRLLTRLGFDFVKDELEAGDDFLDGHGTPVAVLAAGKSLGVAPAAQIMPIDVCNSRGQCLASDVIQGVCHALNKAPNGMGKLVLNLSLGGDTPVDEMKAILEYAVGQGTLIAAAAGNQGSNNGGKQLLWHLSLKHYPAAFDLSGLVAVGALELKKVTGWGVADFSSEGTYVDIAAPGVNISSGAPDGTTKTYSGTSFATPLVAGGLALWRQARPEQTSALIFKSLISTTTPLEQPKNLVGNGMLNLSSVGP
jgi:subtilisin